MCPFPEYSEGWLTNSNQKDPHSEFVLKRKFDLEVLYISSISIFS